jgi:hypothetical protein
MSATATASRLSYANSRLTNDLIQLDAARWTTERARPENHEALFLAKLFAEQRAELAAYGCY